MKNFIIGFFILLFFSCTSDDDKKENPIDNPSFSVDLLLNRWKYNQVNINGQQFLYGHQPNCNKDEFTFANTEGQIRQYSELTFVNDICSSNTTIMEWKIKNDIISLYFGIEKVIDFKVITLTAESFVYSYIYDIDNDNVADNIIIFAVPYE